MKEQEIKKLKERIEELEKEKMEMERKYKKLLFMFQPELYRIIYPNDTDDDIKNVVDMFKYM